MFLKSLKLSSSDGVIRQISFHAGLNLIVDESPSDSDQVTGNNVGKTTVLMLIDFCLGAGGKGIYTDPENKKSEYLLVKSFLMEKEVLVTLTLKEDLTNFQSSEIVIERNFLPRKQMIRRVNGLQKTEDEFESMLTDRLFPGHFGKKPTFPQIISHNIRYKELSVTNTLRTLNGFTRDDEYETLHLFLLGCNFERGDARQNLLAQIRLETAFKLRLEAVQTRSGFEASMALLSLEIGELNEKRTKFHSNPDFGADLIALDEVKYKISITSATSSRLKLRLSLLHEAVEDVKSGSSKVDVGQLKSLYLEVTDRLSGVQKTFEELLSFHNKMVDEKARFISKEIPALRAKIEADEAFLTNLLDQERMLAPKISKSGTLAELELLVVELNEKHRRLGEYGATIKQISTVEATIQKLNGSLGEIDDELFSTEFESKIQGQLNKFNRYFSLISQELYGEQYALKVDRVLTRAGQQVYKFTSFNTNFSSGKKQGEITCFDIAYTLFADEEGIPCFHFLLNDKKELMHDNQLTKIGRLVDRERKHVQFVASILRDKLPTELNQDKYIVIRLSQQEKLFKIEARN